MLHVARPPVAWELHEYWNMERVQRLLTTLPSDHTDRPLLQSLSASVDRETSSRVVRYQHSKNRPTHGRVYSIGLSMQSVTKRVRNYCCAGMCSDIDIVNCFPSILYQITKRYGLELPTLDAYVNRREWTVGHCLSADLSHTLTNDDVKKAFLVTMHGGSYTRVTTRGHRMAPLDEFASEFAHAMGVLWESKEFAHVRAVVDAHNDKHIGSFVSMICQDVEIEAVSAVRTYLETVGITVRVNMFDGLIVSRVPVDREPALIKGCEDAIKGATGYGLQITFKAMPSDNEPLVTAIPMILGPLARFDKVAVLHIDSVVFSGDQIRLGVEAISQLILAGWKIGITADRVVTAAEFGRVAQIIGTDLVAVFGSDHYYTPRCYERWQSKVHHFVQPRKQLQIPPSFERDMIDVVVIGDLRCPSDSNPESVYHVPAWDYRSPDDTLCGVITHMVDFRPMRFREG